MKNFAHISYPSAKPITETFIKSNSRFNLTRVTYYQPNFLNKKVEEAKDKFLL